MTRGGLTPAAIAISATTFSSCRSSGSSGRGGRPPSTRTRASAPAPLNSERVPSQAAAMTREPGRIRTTARTTPAWRSLSGPVGTPSKAWATNLSGSRPGATRKTRSETRTKAARTSGVMTALIGIPMSAVPRRQSAVSRHVVRRFLA